jgi:UMF1 family MFS transporter
MTIMHDYHGAQVDRSTAREGLLRGDNNEPVEILQDDYVRISSSYGALSPEYTRTNNSDGDYSLDSAATRQGVGPMPWFESPFWTNVGGIPLQKEATGQGMDAAAKGILHVSTAFLGPALIQLAYTSADERFCQDQHNDVDDDNNICSPTEDDLRVFGLRPSSILTVSSVTATAVAAVALPFIGALIDRSSHRKTVGAATAFALVFFNAIQVMLSQQNWPMFWLSKTVADFTFVVHTSILLAFMKDLTTDSGTLATYSSKFSILHFTFTAGFTLFVIVFAHWAHQTIVQTSRSAHLVSAVIGFFLLGYSWIYLFGHRPKRGGVRAEDSFVQNTFLALHATIGKIRKHYPALKWFMLTLLWSPDLGSGTLMSIFGTLQKSLMQMSSAQIGMFNLTVLLSTIVGAYLAGYLNRRFNPLFSFRLCLVTLSFVTALMSVFVRGPEQLRLFFLLSAAIGVTFGWLVPTERVLFCTLAPVGQEAEMMGLILCVHSAAAWLPPLLFSVMNEAGFSLQWALASQDVIYGLAIVTSLGVGDYETAVQQARDTSKIDAVE